MNDKSVVIGLSGGVDSSVSALLLQRKGWQVYGVWLDMGLGSCEPARSVAKQLGIPFTVLTASDEHERLVRAPFCAEYTAGRTPNPCTVCNETVKIPLLVRFADSIGINKIATGHYASVENRLGHACLRRTESDKDQSYMLARVHREHLERMILPLGGLTKPEIRQIAVEAGLSNAKAPDSQDICFIPNGDYGSWLESRGISLPPGNFIDSCGKLLGKHRGLHRYTVGQRRGLGISADSRLYVCSLSPETNTVVLGPESALMTNCIFISDIYWGAVNSVDNGTRCEVKTRSRPTRYLAEVFAESDGLVLHFDNPLRRPSPGQLAVAYDSDGFVLFAGTISTRPVPMPVSPP